MEIFIDMYGVGSLLNLIEEICYEKAEHVREQDQDMCNAWVDTGAAISKIALPFCPLP